MQRPPVVRTPSIVQLLQFSLRPLEFFDACARRYGDVFTVRLPSFGDYVMLGSPALVKQVFTEDSETLHAGKANALLEPIVGANSVLLLDGKPHLRQRRLLLPPLHGERMHAYAELMAKITRDALRVMPRGEPFSIHGPMQSITLQVILRAVFGLDEGAQMDALATLLTEYLTPPPAIFTFLPLEYADFPLSPYRAFVRRREAVDRELRKILRARMATPDPTRTDILSLLLSARDEDGRAMSEDELRDELLTMLLAGHETTATALAWTFACILDTPEVSARLDDELARVRGANGEIDIAALVRNEYLDAVVKESLRLRPIIPDVVRRVQQPYRIAGYDVPVGAFLTPCIHLVHRRADLYPEPDRFRPDRFVGVKPDPYAWFPFGGGIRRCLGMAFALYEMKVVLGIILAHAQLRLADQRPIGVVRRGITLAPSGGTRVVLRDAKRSTRFQSLSSAP